MEADLPIYISFSKMDVNSSMSNDSMISLFRSARLLMAYYLATSKENGHNIGLIFMWWTTIVNEQDFENKAVSISVIIDYTRISVLKLVG